MDPKTKAKNIEESVEKAKEAVEADISDGTSWRKFFRVDRNRTADSSNQGELVRRCHGAVFRLKMLILTGLKPNNSFLFFSVVLGNAYLSLFFVSNQDPKILSLAMRAYQQAVSSDAAENLCQKREKSLSDTIVCIKRFVDLSIALTGKRCYHQKPSRFTFQQSHCKSCISLK